MARLIWSPRSIRDLDAICEYIARDSGHYARLVGQRIVEAVERIPDFPKAGGVVPEYDDENLRERFVFSYRIIYRLKNNAIELVTIFHPARQLPPITDLE